MRTSADLITELEGEAASFKMVALAVGFDNHTEFVFADDQRRAKKLANLMQKGGEPIGLMGIQMTGEKSHASHASRAGILYMEGIEGPDWEWNLRSGFSALSFRPARPKGNDVI